MQYDKIFEYNRAWAEAELARDPHFFEQLAAVQRPAYLYIGCSDSRAPINLFAGLGPGEVFVHRNVGNVVANTDLNAAAAIEFAVVHLGVKHVVVCGHTQCGAVKAAMQARDLGILNPWLRNIRDVYRFHQAELDAIADEAQRYDRLVELNVIEQCNNVIKIAAVQRAYVATGSPQVHGWLFDLRTGRIRDLGIHFEERLRHIQEIYDLSE